jgi:Protein of unknown function (DUF3035)
MGSSPAGMNKRKVKTVSRNKAIGLSGSLRLTTRVAGFFAAAAILAACSGVKDDLGLGKQAPDEFTIVTKAPLILPPDFTLRPPEPGAPRPVENQPTQMARTALVTSGAGAQLGNNATSASSGETSILNQAGAAGASSEIRSTIDRENALLAEEEDTFINSIMFWKKDEPKGTIVDAKAESKRLQDNAAQGTDGSGDDLIVIKKKDRGIFN